MEIPAAATGTPPGDFDYRRMTGRTDGTQAGGVLRLPADMQEHGARPLWIGYLHTPAASRWSPVLGVCHRRGDHSGAGARCGPDQRAIAAISVTRGRGISPASRDGRRQELTSRARSRFEKHHSYHRPRRCPEIEPNNALLLRWRGHRYPSVREFDPAFADLTRGGTIDSGIYGIWYHLGVVQYLHGDFADAVASFAKAQPIAPDAGELAGSTDWLWMSLIRAGRGAEAKAMLDRRPDSKRVTNAYTRRLQLCRGEIGPDAVLTPADTEDVQVATLGLPRVRHIARICPWWLKTCVTTRRITSAGLSTHVSPGSEIIFRCVLSSAALARAR